MRSEGIGARAHARASQKVHHERRAEVVRHDRTRSDCLVAAGDKNIDRAGGDAVAVNIDVEASISNRLPHHKCVWAISSRTSDHKALQAEFWIAQPVCKLARALA